MNTNKEYWFPINLSKKEFKKLEDLKVSVDNGIEEIDETLLNEVDKKMTVLLKQNVELILERNSLPNLSHLICGWGNFVYDNESLVERISDFIFFKEGVPFVKQCDPEGDFHPWQSFAYMSMAGVDFDNIKIKEKYSLKDVAFNSTFINKNKGEELGHLLFAFANNYKEEDLTKSFNLNGAIYDLKGLVDFAVDAHDYGGFEVCRKFHLTEGLCAIVSKIDSFNNYKSDAQRFLDGQTEMIGLIQLIFEQVLRKEGDLELLTSLRDKLVILSYFENHIYYLGHAIENTCFGLMNGYKVSLVNFKMMVKAINTANKFLYDFGLDEISFLESFLSLGHYRRASYFLLEISRIIDRKQMIINSEINLNKVLQKYTVDLNQEYILIDNKLRESKNKSFKEYFLFSNREYDVLPRLKEVIENKLLKSSDFQFIGGFEHFRRYHPENWPRSVHYEIIQYKNNENIGVEIHIEDLIFKSLFSCFEEIYSSYKGELELSIDNEWYGCGRLMMVHDKNISPESIIYNFFDFVELTKNRISLEINEISR